MKIAPKLPPDIHPLRKISLVLVFAIITLALIQENLSPKLFEQYAEILRYTMISVGCITFVLMILVQFVEKKSQTQIKKSDDFRAQQQAELEQLNYQESESQKKS